MKETRLRRECQAALNYAARSMAAGRLADAGDSLDEAISALSKMCESDSSYARLAERLSDLCDAFQNTPRSRQDGLSWREPYLTGERD